MLSSLIKAGTSLLGGLMGSRAADSANDQNIKMQKQFAQEGIQWRVADAKKAGIHPLYALGAQTASFAPSSVGDPIGGAISDMGQDIGRAVDAASTSGDRVINKAITSLQLERAGLENELLRSQIARERGQLGPGFPGTPTLIEGQGDTSAEKVVPPQRTTNFRAGLGPVALNPNFSDAQTWEDRYGDSEIAQMIAGGTIAAADVYNALKSYLVRTVKPTRVRVRGGFN